MLNTKLFHTISQTNLLTENDIPASASGDQVTDEKVDCVDKRGTDNWSKNNHESKSTSPIKLSQKQEPKGKKRKKRMKKNLKLE